jgi:hypothetical protein
VSSFLSGSTFSCNIPQINFKVIPFLQVMQWDPCSHINFHKFPYRLCKTQFDVNMC